MILNEEYLSKVVRTSLNEVMSKRTLINQLYKAVEPYTKSLYHDDSWKGVDMVLNAIEQAGAEPMISVEDGGYRNSKGGNTLFAGDDVSYWKEYKLQVYKDGITINGVIKCHAAGTVDDVFSAYDMTVSLW